ncbi:MAG TPA: aldehyde dehydrogenase family protein [Steroidobacteraceae bacterium]|nr:aldehyde dehydrogenase family protein [Steroidobacteraceae bacterium]
MSPVQRTISPVDGRVYVERPYANAAQIDAALAAAVSAQRSWRATPIEERARICRAFAAAFERQRDAVAPELSWQMGRPSAYAPNEVRGTLERARYMIDAAAEALADIDVGAKAGFTRFIRREPLGVVLTIAAWNYPYLISINSVVPALMAGNAVILKHSAQTPLCAERFAACFAAAGLPEGVFHALHLTHADTERVIGDARISHVAFTGSVGGGRAVQRAAAARFIGVGLELGGNDPAYVRADAHFDHAVENLVDGAFFNSGQSCCGIGRIYVHESLHARFIDAFVDLTNRYRLGNPLDRDTTLGPVVRTEAAQSIRRAIADAVRGGARGLIDTKRFPADADGTPYLAPQVLVDVDHRMPILREEIFGPLVNIMKVGSDEEAVKLMNDSAYGLTASVWTADEEAALRIGGEVDTGTWFMNRCDYLDPALAWVGVKDSGRGCTLSVVGYEHLTRPKSFHLRTQLQG